MRILLTTGSDSDSHEFAEAISCNGASSESQLQQLVEDAIRGLTQSGLLVKELALESYPSGGAIYARIAQGAPSGGFGGRAEKGRT
jgi:hypothetical protein